MSDKQIFLWPKGEFNFSTRGSYFEIESFFKDLYPHTYPVLFPSVRSLFPPILRYAGLKRANRVWIPPYSSHCVVNSVAMVVTPSPDRENCQGAVVFHQWGIPFKLTNRPNFIIEDSADSFCLNEQGLFPNDGEVEVLSLPKIFGSFMGGLALCKNEKIARAILKERDNNWFASLCFVTKHYSADIWSHLEVKNTGLPRLALHDIYQKIQNWDSIAKDRMKKLNYLQSKYSLRYQLSPQRIICNFPLEHNQINAQKLKQLNVNLGVRNILIEQDITNLKTQEVLPLPIHHEVSYEKLTTNF